MLLRQAQAELTAIGARLEQQYPESNQGRGVWAMGLQDVLEPRFRALLFGVFAALAVCLAMAGVYGVMAFGVQQRAKEIGLRMALGANRATVVRLILKQGFVLAAIGLAIGLAAAVAATRLVTTMLFEVKPLDIQVYAGVVVLVGVVTLLAGYLPARRAAALDPITVLKTD